MATFILLLFWLFPVLCGGGLTFIFYVYRDIRHPRRKNKLDLVIAFFVGCILGAGIEALALMALGSAILGMFAGVK